MLTETGQNQLVQFVAQRHAVSHLGGVNTQFKELNTLLQIDQKHFRGRVINHQRTALGGGIEQLRHLFAVGIRRRRHRQHHTRHRIRQ